MSTEYRLEMTGITKDYSGNRVLDNVQLIVAPGEIHALMGENGAGKSTLMNILFGMPVIHNTGGFSGTVKLDGEEVQITSPQQALALGIGMVHQEFMLIPGFTVTENIKVGREITSPTLLSKVFGKPLESLQKEQMAKDARIAMDSIGMNIDEYTMVKGMPVGYMQFVEIAREIDKTGIRLLIFDEPTAVLTESEAATLLEAMRTIAKKGISIIFITHRIDEVIEVTNSMTVLRDGQFVKRVKTSETNAIEVARLMIGRKVEKLVDKAGDARSIHDDDIILELKNFHVKMPGEAVRGVDLKIRRGEIFGIGGLAGQGKIGIPNGIFGLYPASGTAVFEGAALDLNKLGEALKKGIGFVSEDRRGVGLLLDESIEENIAFTSMEINNRFLKKIAFTRFYNKKESKAYANEMIKALDIRCTGCQQSVGSLSGGNQQKVCVARALALNPKLLIVSEPTRGIDIGAKKLVLEFLSKLNTQENMTIIIVSSELTELRSISDRIAVIAEGKVASVMKPDDSDEAFGLAMAGMAEVLNK